VATPVPLTEHITAERAAFLDLLDSLEAAEFKTPSLCKGWTVADVAAHAISYDRINPFRYVPLFVGSGFSIDRVNGRMVSWWRRRGTEAVVDAFRRSPTPRGMMRLLGHRIALLDIFIHQQDVRRPIGRPRDIPSDRLTTVGELLRHHRIGAGGAERAKGLRFQAEDIEWSAGDGPVVRGPAEAILMALAGRRTALDELGGEGKQQFAERV